jgi:hypothetical protein
MANGIDVYHQTGGVLFLAEEGTLVKESDA